MRKTRYILALLAIPALASAQDLNPTVEVTNAYDTGTAGIVKPEQKISVPDSVMRFDYDFDYSVFDKPYQGAYEFTPYLVQLRPQARPTGENTFYLKAGAGFRLHPEVDVVWTPVNRGALRLNVFGNHRSYVGKYRGIGLSAGSFTDDNTRWSGHDLNTTAGVDGRYDWSGGTALFSAAYRNIAVKDTLSGPLAYNGVSLRGHVGNPDRSAAFFYDADLKYDYLASSGGFYESRFAGEAEAGIPFDSGRLLGTVHLDVDGTAEGLVGNIYAVPRYAFSQDALRLDLGVKLSAVFRSDAAYHPKKSGIVFPAVKVAWYLLDDQLVLQAAATGGDHLNLFGNLLESNHFLRSVQGWEALDNSVERLTVMAGVRGSLLERFHYDLQLGYTRWQNGLLYGNGSSVPALCYADYNLLFADLVCGWKSSYLDADGHIRFGKTDVDPAEAFVPAAFTGDVRALLKWGDRIKAGADAAWSSPRAGTPGDLPGYVDLGLYGEFALNRTFGVWGRVGNLLNQTIQRVPFYAEDGIWFTGGIRLNL